MTLRSKAILAADRFGFSRFVSRCRREPVYAAVVYHRVGSTAGRAAGLPIIEAAALRQQLRWLQAHAQVVDFHRWFAGLTGKYKPQGAAAQVLITFDDGYRDTLYHGLPVCRDLGIRPLIFLTTGYIERPRLHAWWDLFTLAQPLRQNGGAPEIPPLPEALRRSPTVSDGTVGTYADYCASFGWRLPSRLGMNQFARWDELWAAKAFADFGAHTVWHPVLGELDPAAATHEIVASGNAIEANLWRRPAAFAYPFGKLQHISPAVVAQTRSAGYECAFTNISGIGERSGDPFLLPRVCGGEDIFEKTAARLVLAGLPVGSWYGRHLRLTQWLAANPESSRCA